MLLALAPIIPILGALILAGGGITWWWIYRREDDGLAGPKALPPGTENPGAPKELVDQYVGTYKSRRFHNTQAGDSINELVSKTLNAISPGAGSKPGLIGAVRRLMNMSEFNRRLFGESIGGDAYAIDGIAINRFALPKHEDTVEVMRLGFLPIRNIDAAGTRVGPAQKWGDPWVVGLNEDAVAAGVTDPALLLGPDWSDGSSATEPPPEILAVLEERD